MSHKEIIISCLFVLYGCSSSRHSLPNNSIYSNPEKSSFHFQKVNFRIETDGQLRTHRSSLSFYADTLIRLSITSGFNKQIAFVVFDDKGMQFFDLYSRSGFFISAKEFADEFGICNFPQTLKSYLLGYTLDSLPSIKVSNKINCTSDNTEFTFEDYTNQYNSIQIKGLQSDNSLLVKYLWNRKSTNIFPHSTYLTILLKGMVYEFDL